MRCLWTPSRFSGRSPTPRSWCGWRSGLIVLFCQAATRKMSLVPAGFQNFAEWMFESLYDFLAGLMGDHLTKRVFWFFGTIFFFILVNNYMGLIPGVGTIGWRWHGPMVRHCSAARTRIST